MVRYSKHSGLTLSDAVIITGAQTHWESVMAEQEYIRNVMCRKDMEFQIEEQNLLHARGKHYDIVKVKFADGTRKTIFFDVTEPYNAFVIYPQ